MMVEKPGLITAMTNGAILQKKSTTRIRNTWQSQAYNVDGSTYFKLRNIGKLFDFPVNFDVAKNQIAV